MKQALILASAAALLAAGCATDVDHEARSEDEARLAEELAGYEQSGPARACVAMRDLGGNRSAGEAAIIFGGTGRNLWVNRPAAGCPKLGVGQALQTRTSGTQLCSGDIATVFDTTNGMSYGGCALGEFTPYRRRGS